jgi:diguanylate cyclase (GGDEF)-like protein
MAAAQQDRLTGAASRVAFDARLFHGCSTLARDGRPLAVLLVEVDHFKRHFDELGQAGTDRVLRQIAQIAESVLTPSDLLARWGDHAFGVLLPDTDDAGALHMAERLRTGVEQASGPDGPVTVSIGASSALAHSDASPYELLTRSDRALSACKAEGCNRSQLFIGPYW